MDIYHLEGVLLSVVHSGDSLLERRNQETHHTIVNGTTASFSMTNLAPKPLHSEDMLGTSVVHLGDNKLNRNPSPHTVSQ